MTSYLIACSRYETFDYAVLFPSGFVVRCWIGTDGGLELASGCCGAQVERGDKQNLCIRCRKPFTAYSHAEALGAVIEKLTPEDQAYWHKVKPGLIKFYRDLLQVEDKASIPMTAQEEQDWYLSRFHDLRLLGHVTTSDEQWESLWKGWSK